MNVTIDASSDRPIRYDATSRVLSGEEAERLVEDLKEFDLETVGTKEWTKQHGIISKLNLQAHQCVMAKADNFVMEATVTYDKVGVLIHELLVAEVWTRKVFPELRERAVKIKNGALRCYFILYHQATLINLLEVILYHDYVAEAGGDRIVELVDFCARQVTYLNGLVRRNESEEKIEEDTPLESFRKKMKNHDPLKDLNEQAKEMAFRVAVSAVAVLRYLTEHVTKLPLGVMNRLLDTHDVSVATVSLIENPPWTRRRRVRNVAKKRTETVWEKYGNEGRWERVAPEDLLQLTKHEAQAWLILYNLLCEGKCRKLYHFNSHRKDAIVRVRKYLNEVLLDQLPVLAHVQRYLDELTIMEAPPAATMSSRFVLEQVAATRESIVRGKDFRKIADETLRQAFETDDGGALRELAGIYGSDAAMSVFAASEGNDDGAPATKSEATKNATTRSPMVGAIVRVISSSGSGESNDYQYVVRSDVEPKTVETSKGSFTRYHMTLLKSAPPIEPDAQIVVTALDATGAQTIVDEDEHIQLRLPTSTTKPPPPPTADDRELVAVDETLSTSQWYKQGDLANGIVAQIKLKRRDEVLQKYAARGRFFGLSDLFISASHDLDDSRSGGSDSGEIGITIE